MFKTIKSRLVADWKWVLKNSWSIRLMAIAAFLSGAEVVLPLFSDRFHNPYVYALLTFMVVSGAFVARLFAQRRDEE
jgi:hypothetical protein